MFVFFDSFYLNCLNSRSLVRNGHFKCSFFNVSSPAFPFFSFHISHPLHPNFKISQFLTKNNGIFAKNFTFCSLDAIISSVGLVYSFISRCFCYLFSLGGITSVPVPFLAKLFTLCRFFSNTLQKKSPYDHREATSVFYFDAANLKWFRLLASYSFNFDLFKFFTINCFILDH